MSPRGDLAVKTQRADAAVNEAVPAKAGASKGAASKGAASKPATAKPASSKAAPAKVAPAKAAPASAAAQPAAARTTPTTADTTKPATGLTTAAQAAAASSLSVKIVARDAAASLDQATRKARSGTQSIERAVLVLKELAAQPHFGWRATDLAGRCGLDRATTHRILASLARSRLAQQRSSDKRYTIGPLLFELAVGLPGMEELRRLADEAMDRLARRSRAVAFFYLRSGNDFTCLARAGTAPIQSLMFEVGTRRPLMSSAGGVAILLAMAPEEMRAVVAENRARLARWEAPMEGVERIWEESLRNGRAVNRAATVAGWNALALPVRDVNGAPFGAIMLAGIADEFPGTREASLLDMVGESVGTLERALMRGFDRKKRIAV